MGFSVIKIDLDTYSNMDELRKTFIDLTKGNPLIDENGRVGSVENLVLSTWEAKIGDLLGFRINKIWFDTNTWIAIAYEGNKEQNFFDNFISFLRDSPCISSGDIPIPQNTLPKKEQSLNLDFVLDKINAFGIGSLTDEEKDFLKSC
jgi:hypothetical protein